jgi:hypothetical protein
MIEALLTLGLLYSIYKQFKYKHMAEDVYEEYFALLNENNALNKSVKILVSPYIYRAIMETAVNIMSDRAINYERTSKSTEKR